MARKTKKVKELDFTLSTTQSNRKLMRRILKNRIGSNRIRGAWDRFQISRYGLYDLRIIHSKNQPFKKRRAKSALA